MRTLYIGIFLMITGFGLIGCAHIQSGHYIQLSDGQTLEDIAEKYGLNSRDLASANVGREVRSGEWVFVPLNRGLIQLFQNRVQYGNISYSHQFLSSGKFLWPVPESTRISSHYGHRWGRIHHGVDIPGRIGMNVIAVEDGVVLYASSMGGYGKLIAIRHAGGYNTVYAHLNDFSVRPGQRVRRGEVIGELGNTGRSTGPHLHFEVRRGTESIDPMAYIKQSRDYVIAYNQN